jgi:hypothetical protein
MEDNNQAITVNVKLEKEEVGEYSAIILKSKLRLTKRQLFLLTATAVIFSIAVIYTLISGNTSSDLPASADKPVGKISIWPIVILFVLIIYRIGAPMITKIIAMRQFESNKLLHKVTEYTFSPEGIQVESEVRTEHWRWGNVFKLIETKKYLAILESSQSANVIPKHCFSSEEELLIVTKLLKDRIPEEKYEVIKNL